jgi:hypothetical protein
MPTRWTSPSATSRFNEGQVHHKRRKLFTETFLCMFNAEKTGITPPISLDDYVLLPHVLTSMAPGRSARGFVDDALEKLGLRRSVALTTQRFLTVPSLVCQSAPKFDPLGQFWTPIPRLRGSILHAE